MAVITFNPGSLGCGGREQGDQLRLLRNEGLGKLQHPCRHGGDGLQGQRGRRAEDRWTWERSLRGDNVRRGCLKDGTPNGGPRQGGLGFRSRARGRWKRSSRASDGEGVCRGPAGKGPGGRGKARGSRAEGRGRRDRGQLPGGPAWGCCWLIQGCTCKTGNVRTSSCVRDHARDLFSRPFPPSCNGLSRGLVPEAILRADKPSVIRDGTGKPAIFFCDT